MEQCKFYETGLDNSDFRYVRFKKSKFFNTDFTDCHLTECDITGMSVDGINVKDALEYYKSNK